MTEVEALLTLLRTLNIRVRVEDGAIRCKPARGVLPNDLVPQIRALKPQLLDLLNSEEEEIGWRFETIGERLIGDGAERRPGFCSYCGAAMPDQQTGKCTLCVLAAMQFLEQRGFIGRATYPEAPSDAGRYRQTGTVRDMSREGEAA